MTRPLLTLSLLFAGACGDDANSLGGSIEESFSLDFDRVEIRKISTDLVIEYQKGEGDEAEKICKVVVDTENLDLGDDTNLSGATFLQRVTINRVAKSGGDFPSVKSGSIHFDVFDFTAGGVVDGDFDAVFENGRTIHGNFDDRVEEVSLE